MTNILVSRDGILEKMMKRAMPASVIMSYADLDLIPDQVLERAEVVLYDESSVSLTKLMEWEAVSWLGEKLIILTEKHSELIQCRSQAKVFSYPINLGEVYKHVANIDS